MTVFESLTGRRAALLVVTAAFLLLSLPWYATAQTFPQSDSKQVSTFTTADIITGFESLKEHYRTLQPRNKANDGPAAAALINLSGLVVDETRSRLGRQFYDLFYSQWEAPRGAGGHTVKVEERPGLGRGSVVFVRIDDELVYGSRLQPRYSEIEQAAKAAVYYATRHLQQQVGSRLGYQ